MTEHEKYLLSACIKGDQAGWNEFVRRYSKLIYGSIQRTLLQYHHPVRPEIIEELHQELFLSLIGNGAKKLRQFRGENNCSLASWVRVLASRLTIDYLRRENGFKSIPARHLLCADTDPMRPLMERENEHLLDRARLSLPARDQQLLQLHYQKELSPEKVAGILKISIGAFYTQKSRILDKLRRTLETFTAL